MLRRYANWRIRIFCMVVRTMENLEIKIILEKDRKEIHVVDINGSEHYMYCEPQEEKKRYLNMTVRAFIADYVKYHESTQEKYEREEDL